MHLLESFYSQSSFPGGVVSCHYKWDLILLQISFKAALLLFFEVESRASLDIMFFNFLVYLLALLEYALISPGRRACKVNSLNP